MLRKRGNIVGYWASQQYSMHDLIKFVNEAESRGFNTCLTSDHFHPWWHDNGYGNLTWVWLATAAAKTKNEFPVIVISRLTTFIEKVIWVIWVLFIIAKECLQNTQRR
jgi:hypothetical protein